MELSKLAAIVCPSITWFHCEDRAAKTFHGPAERGVCECWRYRTYFFTLTMWNPLKANNYSRNI